MSGTVVTLLETQIFAALRTVLMGFNLLSSTPGEQVPIVLGQVNRVPQPRFPDHVVMWPLRRLRLSTNIDDYFDVTFVGALTGNVLTVASVTTGPVQAGQTIYGPGVTAGCRIVAQLTGVPGDVGTYATTPTADVASTTLYSGFASIVQPTDMVIQCDVHGPASGDNAQIISTLLRDYVGVDAFVATNTGVLPLYADDPRQGAFVDAEAQFENRWIVEVHLQANPAVLISAQFPSSLLVTSIPVDVLAPIPPPPPPPPPPPDAFWNDGGVLALFNGANYPTSPVGLAPGKVWRDDFTVAVVPGHTPNPHAPAVFFGTIRPSQLLAMGGGNLPLTPPPSGSLQLWNNGNLVSVAEVVLPPPPPPPVNEFWNDGGVLALFDGENYPTGPTGLTPGDVWRNDLTIAVVAGITPDPFAAPVFFGAITPAQLLVLGGGNLPLTPPTIGSLQLWNNDGLVSVA